MNNPLMRVVFILIGLFLICCSLIAQKTDSLPPYTYRPVVALKFAPLALIDYTPAIQFAVEVKTFRHQSFQLEYGFVTDLYNRTQYGFNGYKFKTEYRFYNRRSIKVLNNTFWGVQYMWKPLNAQSTTIVWRDNQTYQEIVPVRISNKTNSIYLISGCVFHFLGPLYFEVMTGIGPRWLKVSYYDIPDDVMEKLGG